MKKVISILLVGVMLMSFMSVSAFAQTTINSELQSYLDSMDDDDLVWVWIWIRSKIDTEALERQALVECGLLGENLDTQEEIDMYKSARTRLYSQQQTAENQAVIDKIGVAKENIDFLSSLSPSFIVQLTKEQVHYAVSLDEVTSVNYYEKEEPVPDVDMWDPSYKDVSQFKYYDKMVEYIGEYYESAIRYVYDEVYYHYSDDNTDEPDWALISCGFNPQPIAAKYGTLVGDRILSVVGGGCGGFIDGYGVYVRETDSFITLRQNKLEEIVELCPEFVESIVENEIGQHFGDVDSDGELSVVDVTYIQRFLAGYHDYIQTYFLVTLDGGKGHVIVPDFDRDGTTTVLDATAIQQKLAGLDKEPQFNEELLYVEYEEVFYPNSYPKKPGESAMLDFKVEVLNNSYSYSTHHLGHPENFLAVVKTKEQYDHIFQGLLFKYDEEFFETHWLVSSVVHASCDEEIAKIDNVSIMDDTLYVYVNQYMTGPNEDISVTPPYLISLVAIEKEKLANVTNIVRVEK